MGISDYKEGLDGKEPGILKEIFDKEGYSDQKRGYQDYLRNVDLERRIRNVEERSSCRDLSSYKPVQDPDDLTGTWYEVLIVFTPIFVSISTLLFYAYGLPVFSPEILRIEKIAKGHILGLLFPVGVLIFALAGLVAIACSVMPYKPTQKFAWFWIFLMGFLVLCARLKG